MKKILALVVTSSLVLFIVFSGATEVLGSPGGAGAETNSVRNGQNI